MEALLRLDRRIIFLLLFVALLVTQLFASKIELPVVTTDAVKGVWAPIEKLPAGSPILVALDYDAASSAELDPMARAGLRQVFRRNLRMISMTHWPTGVQWVKNLVDEMAKEFDDLRVEVAQRFESETDAETFILGQIAAGTATSTASTPGADPLTINVGRKNAAPGLPWSGKLLDAAREAEPGLLVKPVPGEGGKWLAVRLLERKPTLEYGKDYSFLGTKAGEQVLVLTMGQSIPTAFPSDPRTGKPTRELPIMRGVESLKDFKYLLEIAAGSSAEWWIIYGAQRAGIDMGVGCTAVMAPDMYPFYGAGQIKGLCGGIKGAWEYEKLVETPGRAMKAIPAQTVAHMLVILLIVFCNIAYFVTRGRGANP